MEYTVQKLGKLAGVSARTLRYYDEIGLLKPARVSSNGYRIYGQAEVDRLQHILFYRELGLGLETIQRLMTAPDFDSTGALKEHREQLLAKRKQLDMLLANVERTIAAAEGGEAMSDHEKFAGFKQKLIEDNEKKHGKEARAKYGDAEVDRANAKLRHMTEKQYGDIEQLGRDVITAFQEAFAAGDPAGELAQKAADLHRQWVSFYWDSYSKEAHAGLAQMYVDDERFTAYYDQHQPGLAVFIRDAVQAYTAK
ncbi:MerR family transcriptional regulator [Ectobacillus ponti]|uniref:MerR family transcriptional regulator n=1 Tax=Ectobacillus ponti TaxID=2961894 RepID=A0AA42BQL2_9BACI|nr:MerR family transcriptional regulator [Ectobacillus ponti]